MKKETPVRPLIIADSKDNLHDPFTLHFQEGNKNLFGFSKSTSASEILEESIVRLAQTNADTKEIKPITKKVSNPKQKSPLRSAKNNKEKSDLRKNKEAETPAFGSDRSKGFFKDAIREGTERSRSITKV